MPIITLHNFRRQIQSNRKMSFCSSATDIKCDKWNMVRRLKMSLSPPKTKSPFVFIRGQHTHKKKVTPHIILYNIIRLFKFDSLINYMVLCTMWFIWFRFKVNEWRFSSGRLPVWLRSLFVRLHYRIHTIWQWRE